MKTPPPDRPFDPDDPNFDPWADDPNAPKEPGLTDDADIPWQEAEESDEYEGDEVEEVEDPTPDPLRVDASAPVRGPVGLLDSGLRGEIEFEILFQQTRAELLRPPPAPTPGESRRNFQLLAGSLVLFLLSFLADDLRWVGLLVGVVFVHELGHFLAMRYFGYRDVRMFFVPFFGAAVVGRHETAAAWKRTVTYLAGPLPGLVLGTILMFAFRPPVDSTLFQLCRMLLILNAFNLLPVVPLDGGRVLESLFLSRRPWAGTVFRAFAIAVLVVMVLWVETVSGKVILSLIALFTLLATPLTHRQARSRKVLAGHFPKMPEKLADVPNAALRELFGVTLAVAGGPQEPTRLAAVMRDLHGQAAMRSAGPLTAASLLVVYVLAWVVAVVGLAPIAQAELARDAAVRGLIADYQDGIEAEGKGPKWEECVAHWRAAEPPVRRDAYGELDELLLKSPAGTDYRPQLQQAAGK